MKTVNHSARFWRVSGVLLCVWGALLALYVPAARMIGFWSADISLALLLIWGLLCLASGCLRLFRKRPLFYFRKKDGLNRLVRLGFAVFCIVSVLLQTLVCSGLFAAPPGDAQAILVLGARVYGSRPSLLLQKRINAAADYLKTHPDCVAVACGGGSGPYTEARVIGQALADAGIDPERILLEETSADTRQNVRNALTVLAENGVDCDTVAVATNDYHLWRAMRLVRQNGLNAAGVRAGTMWYLRPAAHFREMFSVGRDLALSFLEIF